MKTHKTVKVVAVFLSVLMLFSAIPMTAFAAWADENIVYDGSTFGTNGYYNVISKKDYTLVPGAATETEMVINNAAGNRRQVLHILECDPSNPDISIIPGYYNIDKDLSDVNNQKAAGVTDLVKYYEDELGYNVVGAMNTDLDYTDNAPRVLVYNGQNLAGHAGAAAPKSVLCVYKDADGKVSVDVKTYSKAEIDNELANGNATRGQLLHAVSVSFAMTVKDGVLVSKTEERTSSSAARSMVGVKEDGTLVLVMNDGRGANNSVGFCNYELGESMLALGCKWAANCDGGGSSSFVSKRAGETVNTMRCVPCDGAERPTKSSIVIVSNVGPSGELNNVNIDYDYDYFAPGTTYTFGAEAIDTHGYSMDMPADASWALSDASFGTVADGTFTSNGTLGDVDVQVISGGSVVGSRTIHVANPTTLNLSATETTVPYSTPAKVRTINLPMVAKIGENDVFTAGAYNISVSPANGGTVDGLKFTATDDTSVSKAVVTINYAPTNQSFTYTVNYGKGSEVLWDYEDGDISAWTGTDETDQYMRDHGAEISTKGDFSTPFKTLFAGGQISWSNKTTTKLSSVAEGGKAHGGDKALAVTFDMKNVEFNSWVYSIIWNTQGNTVLRDVANGNNATAIGCWVYIPKGFYTVKNNGAQALQLTVQKGPDANTLSGTQLNLQYNGKNINALKESDIPENRWVYVKASLTANNYVKLVDPVNDVYRSASIMRMYVKPSEAQEMTYYFDDWTLDYSSAVDDREPPVISNPTYCTNDTNIDFDDQTITTNTVSFNANVADYAASNAEGLDYDSAMIYVDGVAQRNVSASGNTMGVQNVVLSNGVHNIKFEIADKLGNSTTLTKALTVNADGAKPAVRLAGHNDKNNAIETGSVYYVDVKADNIESIDSVTTTIDLQSAHEWELDNIITAPGFEASYELDSIKDNVATVTITKTGATTLTGEQTIASLPVRVWSYDENTLAGGDGTNPVHYTAAQRYATSYGEPVLMMEANVLYGEVGYTDNTAGTFGGSISEATAVTGNKTKPWHEHDAELTVQNKAATCTEAGYTGRTYCETCGSVVDWGTVVPAKGHSYAIDGNRFVCSDCGDVYQAGTGLFEMNGKTYYAINNNLVKGWQTIENDVYYFGDDYAAVNGSVEIAGITYEFENNILAHGTWVNDGIGLAYYWAGECLHSRWFEEDGKTYHFDASGHAALGYTPVAQGQIATLYHFDETTGALIETITQNGIFFTNNADGDIYYISGGHLLVAGLVKYGDDFYYFPGKFKALRNSSRYIDEAGAHGYVEPGTYYFGDDCKMLTNKKNGPNEDGYFYINDVLQRAYQLIQWEGSYYFISDAHKYAKNVKIYLSEQYTNGTDLVPGYYTFDSTGKIELKNGPDEDGYFYLNGVRQNAYQLIKYYGHYYFVYDGHKYAKDVKLYLTEKFTAGTELPVGSYYFDSTGKMDQKSGPQSDGFFYLNGVRQNAYQIIKWEDNYYFVYDGHKYAKNVKLYLTEQFTNGTDLTPGYYNFDSEGKLILKNGPDADGFFYLNGVRQNAYKLVEFEGEYYFINDGHKYAKNVTLYLGEQFTNGTGFEPGNFTFDSEGKLNVKNGPQSDGYFYLNGVRQSAYKLVEFEDNYYFISDAHKYAKSANVYLGEQFTSGTPFNPGYYSFDENGVMQIKNGPQADGFFYLNNVRQNAYQLIDYNGYFFFINDGHKYTVNKRIYLSASFVEGKTYPNGVPISPGYYTFDKEGKMVVGVDINGVKNVRDIGGWVTTDGKKIKEKMLIRGAELDGAVDPESMITEIGINTMLNDIKVKTEMDLRSPEVGGSDMLGDTVTHKYYDATMYEDAFTEEGKEKMKEVFTDLANPDNYPIYVHCTHGIDRTGTVCYILEAVLGLSEANATSEYSLSNWFRTYNKKKLDALKAGLNEYSGTTLKAKATAYLLDCGITESQINSIRNTLLIG